MVLLWFGFSKFANVTTWRLFVVLVVVVLVLYWFWFFMLHYFFFYFRVYIVRYYCSKFDAYATRLVARFERHYRMGLIVLSFAYRYSYVHTTYLGTLGILDHWRVGVSGRVLGVQ